MKTLLLLILLMPALCFGQSLDPYIGNLSAGLIDRGHYKSFSTEIVLSQNFGFGANIQILPYLYLGAGYNTTTAEAVLYINGVPIKDNTTNFQPTIYLEFRTNKFFIRASQTEGNFHFYRGIKQEDESVFTASLDKYIIQHWLWLGYRKHF